ncbi:MAG: hypothetical protein K0B81_07960 [Candidatus Cloacimonetes bacterium]|nr:hypothetical protein [Candidatus Cloacimonadota bacterium]
MKKIGILLMIVLGITFLSAGRYAGDFLEIGSGVRAIGMGGAFSAIANDGSAIYWNSSGISQLKRIEIGLMRAYLYEGLAYYDHITYCQPLPNDVTIGLNWTRLTIPDIPVFSEQHLVGTTIDQRVTFPDLQLTAVPDAKFTSTDDIIQFAFSKNIQHDLALGWLFFELPVDIYFGANIKYLSRKIQDYSGTGTGFDISVLTRQYLYRWFDARWLGTLSIGINVQDIGGTSISWDTISRQSDEIVMNTKLGFAYEQPLERIKSTLLLATDTDYHVYGQKQRWGIEYTYDKLISGRFGYYDDNQAAGLSLMMFDVSVDYAFITNDLGNTHRIGLRAYF